MTTGDGIVQAIAFAVAITFGASAVGKLRDPSAFVRGVSQYRVLPTWSSAPAASLVIGLDLLIAAPFATGFLLSWAAFAAFVLLAAFGIAVTVNLRRGSAFPCLCFGARSEDRISMWSLGRIGLLASAVLVVLLEQPVSAGSWYGSHGPSGGQLFAALTLGVGIVVLTRWLLAVPALLTLHRAKVSHR